MSSPFPTPPPCSSGKGETPKPAHTGEFTTVLTAEPGSRDARALLSPDDFMAVTATVAARNPDIGWVMAERLVAEALKLVATTADADCQLVPSPLVDEAWHGLILHTAIYQGLCERLGSGFIHHYPELPHAARGAGAAPDRTIAAIEAAGFSIDRELWATA